MELSPLPAATGMGRIAGADTCTDVGAATTVGGAAAGAVSAITSAGNCLSRNSESASMLERSPSNWRNVTFTPNFADKACVTWVRKSESKPISRKLVEPTALETSTPERSSKISQRTLAIFVNLGAAKVAGGRGFAFTIVFSFPEGTSAMKYSAAAAAGAAGCASADLSEAGASIQQRFRSKG